MTAPLHPANPVLLIDDEAAALNSFEIILQANGITNTLRCQDSRRAQEMFREHAVDAVLLDLIMPGVSGEKLLEWINAEHPYVQVIVVTGNDDIESAVRCMKLGACDYLVKPVEEAALTAALGRALELRELRRECASLRSRFLDSGDLGRPEVFESIVTRDPGMLQIFRYLEAIADSRQPVLITGESGVGKELIARAVHELGPARGPFVPVNVAGLDDAMFSDTLFGHVKGAYTGAAGARRGMAEKAAGGVLFLDEVGDLPPASQVKLLRLLQEREFFPLGSDQPRLLDARLVFATNVDLEQKLAAGELRKDLYYRLCTHLVHLPPLRERRRDIPLLVDHFVRKAADEMGREGPDVEPEVVELLQRYGFPGNVRELEAVVYDALSEHGNGGPLSTGAFRKRLRDEALTRTQTKEREAAAESVLFPRDLPTIEETTDMLVREAMRRAGGKQTVASRLLGISQPALSKRLKRMQHPPEA